MASFESRFSLLTFLFSAGGHQRNVPRPKAIKQSVSRQVPPGEANSNCEATSDSPLIERPGPTAQVNGCKEDLQKLIDSSSNSINDVPAQFMLSLRRFVSHRNARRLRTRRPHPLQSTRGAGPLGLRLLSERCRTGIDPALWFGCRKSRSRRSRRVPGPPRSRGSCPCRRCPPKFSGRSSG